MARTTQLRLRLMALFATSALAACGGSADDGVGGTGGTGGTGAQGGSAGNGGSGAQGGSAGNGGSGAQGGSAGNGGSGAQGGSAGAGAQGGSGGVAGAGGAFTCDCGTPAWETCYTPEELPLREGAEVPAPGTCSPGQDLDGTNVEPCASQGWEVWFYGDPALSSEGLCCYETQTGCAVGRPFLVGEEIRMANTLERTDWCSAELLAAGDEAQAHAQREQLSEAWLTDARLEHASVAAFARLTLELLGLGAPPELVAWSQRASLEEVRHAQDCFALASRYAGRAIGPGLLALDGALGQRTLLEVAVCAFREGCVGETVAALLAQEQLALAQDSAVRSVLTRIAEDEASHAELAWQIVRWAVKTGGSEILQGLEQAFRAELASTLDGGVGQAAEAELSAGLNAHGRLTPAQARAVRRQALVEVVGPCFAALQNQARSTSEKPPRLVALS